MLLQTNSYIVPKEKRAEHARLMRRFRQILNRIGCDNFEVYEQVGANWSAGQTSGRFVQIMRFRDRKHQMAVQNAERGDAAAQQLIAEFCELVNYPLQQQQQQFAVGFYSSVLPVAPVRAPRATNDATTEAPTDDGDANPTTTAAMAGAAAGFVGTHDPSEPEAAATDEELSSEETAEESSLEETTPAESEEVPDTTDEEVATEADLTVEGAPAVSEQLEPDDLTTPDGEADLTEDPEPTEAAPAEAPFVTDESEETPFAESENETEAGLDLTPEPTPEPAAELSEDDLLDVVNTAPTPRGPASPPDNGQPDLDAALGIAEDDPTADDDISRLAEELASDDPPPHRPHHTRGSENGAR